MNVEHIKGFTSVLGQPENWDVAKNGTVGGLPVRIEAHGDTISCTSAWKPSPDELAALLAGGNINLRVIGGQPPVSIFVDGVGAADSGYVDAFYDLAKMLDIGARASSPAEVWQTEMRPKLLRLTGGGASGDYQARIAIWMQECFGPEISADGAERNHRFLEEAVELVQSLGCTASEAHQLVDYVFGRPVGEPGQEVGGTVVTLAALCNAHGLDMQAEAEREHDLIWTKVEAIREKQKRKPKVGPLPGVYPEREA